MPFWTRMLKWLGAGPVPPGTPPRFELLGLPHGMYAVLAFIVVVTALAAIFFLYRREQVTGPPWRRYAAWALRALALGLICIVLLQPSVAFDVEQVVPGELVVLADRSASMSTVDSRLPDDLATAWRGALIHSDSNPRKLSRHQIARALLDTKGINLVEALRQKNTVRLITFADSAETVLTFDKAAPASGTSPSALPDWQPTGVATDLAGAISAALQHPRGALAGIIVLSDGRRTAGGDPLDVARAAARQAAPIYAVGIGDPNEPRNVTVVKLIGDEYVTKGSPLRLQALVRARGFAGRTVEMNLEELDAQGGPPRSLGPQSLKLGGDGELQRMDFTVTPERTGEIRYVARATPLEGESDPEDNSVGLRVNVLDDKVKVLLMSGAPSFEYRFVRGLIEREPGFELSVWLQSKAPGLAQGGSIPLAKFPAPDALRNYDLVMLMDPTPEGFSAQWMDELTAAVSQRGSGLMCIAALDHTPDFVRRQEMAKLLALLPVVLNTEGRATMPETHTQSWPVELTREGAQHPVMRVAEDAPKTEAFWAGVPGLYWAYPVERAKPGASVLMRFKGPAAGVPAGGETALIAVQSYGAGRVGFIGSTETWRWRTAGVEEYRRFWVQMLRYLAQGRALGGRRRAQIVTEAPAGRVGQPLRVEARLLGKDFNPLAEETAALQVERGGARVGAIELKPTRAGQGVYEGFFYPDQFGEYDLVYAPPDGQPVRETVRVERPDVEFADVTMARSDLQKLAETSGGRYIEPAQIASLPGMIPDRTQTNVNPGQPIPLWDSTGLMALLLALLTIEWAIRKWIGAL